MTTRPEFTVHILNETGICKAAELADAFSVLLNHIDRLLPEPSRDKSLAITQLQEACFWATRGIATQSVNQVDQ